MRGVLIVSFSVLAMLALLALGCNSESGDEGADLNASLPVNTENIVYSFPGIFSLESEAVPAYFYNVRQGSVLKAPYSGKVSLSNLPSGAMQITISGRSMDVSLVVYQLSELGVREGRAVKSGSAIGIVGNAIPGEETNLVMFAVDKSTGSYMDLSSNPNMVYKAPPKRSAS